MFNPATPFNGLPLLPPRHDLETPAVLKLCIQARAAVAELDASADLIPNPAILINTIPVLEARASSEIENIVTTTDQLFESLGESRGAVDAAIKEALRYGTALWRGTNALATRPISTNLATEVCTTIRGIDTAVRRVPGTTLRNLATGAAVYTPPQGEERLRDLMANWETYLHARDEVDPLVRMAVTHYQFEAIHPFEDGNGRTGRILNLLFLVEQDLLRRPILYLSGAIIRSRAEYYRLLLEVTTRQWWEPWILYMLRAVAETARWTTLKIRAMRALLHSARQRVRERAPKIYSRELVDLVFMQPYCRIGAVVDAGLAKRQTASIYLAKLADIGLLTTITSGREKLFVHRALLDLLTSEAHAVPAYR